tara:strand:- start:1803 stop:2063 length:261 start_codon:yes stop_codon:yes gene_type:complete
MMTGDQEDNRKRWIRDLWACVQYHREKVEETAPLDLVGVSASTELQMQSDEHILHKVFWFAVQEAALLIETLETVEEEIDESSVDS